MQSLHSPIRRRNDIRRRMVIAVSTCVGTWIQDDGGFAVGRFLSPLSKLMKLTLDNTPRLREISLGHSVGSFRGVIDTTLREDKGLDGLQLKGFIDMVNTFGMRS
ncbi:hypothetical protein C8R45DRAFT_922844 [Mycena sanguinolenta]|nr:hypothetical protein C8R45DRAFT_922844 [Mycena sanguinolenta]